MSISPTLSNSNLRKDTSQIPIPLSIAVSISSLLLVLVGGSLFFFPEFARSRWVWSLTPFNTRFLGGIYLTALVALTLHLLRRWAMPVRAIVPMMWVFTSIILLVSCLHLEQFDPHRRATAIWMWLYVFDCIAASYYLGRYEGKAFLGLQQIPKQWSIYLKLQALFLGGYGLGLLIFPAIVGNFWPWPLGAFHSQLYSAIFLTGAMGSAFLSSRSSVIELFTLGAIQFTFSSLVIAGVLLVDMDVRRIDWGLIENWVWIGAIALLGILGLVMMGRSNQNSVCSAGGKEPE